MQLIIPRLAIIGFLVGFIPLLGLTFFSPGLRSEGIFGTAIIIWAFLTLFLLIIAARGRKILWLILLIQIALIVAVFIESFSSAALYLGT